MAAKKIKALFPSAKIAIGGPHALVAAEATLRDHGVLDFACVGDGVPALGGLLNALMDVDKPPGPRNDLILNVPNLLFRESDQIRATRPQGVVAPDWKRPDFSRFPLKDYRGYTARFLKKGPELPSFSSIGCRYKCTFCSAARTPVERRSPAGVADEMEHLTRRYGARSVYFCDENFGSGRQHLDALLDELIQRGGRKKYRWRINTRMAHFDRPGFLRKMEKAGCEMINCGVESASPRILRQIQKQIDLDRVARLAREIKKTKIKLELNFIMGFPGETVRDLKMTREYIFRANPHFLNLSFFTPFPGTTAYQELFPGAQREFSSGMVDSADFKAANSQNYSAVSHKYLTRFYFMTLLGFYLRPARWLSLLRLFPLRSWPRAGLWLAGRLLFPMRRKLSSVS